MNAYPALLSFTLSALLIGLLVPVAGRLGLVDVPEGRKDHALPTPVVGGLAMLAGCTVALQFLPGQPSAPWAFLTSAALIVGIGMYDDRHDVRWYIRIGVHVLAALIIVYGAGLRVEHVGSMFGAGPVSLGWLSVPVTVFATVGLINAMNMIDGSDGLAGSLGLAALAMLCAAAVYSGNRQLAEKVLVVAGAVAGFLWWNLRFPWRERARTFMGDAGSGFLGLVVAWVAFRLTQTPGHPVTPILAVWLLPVPVMDCVVLIVHRLQEGRSPFAAGRDHIHHLMADAGWTPMRIVALLTGFSLLCGGAAALAMRLDVPHSLLLAAYLVLCGGWYLLTRRSERAVEFFRRLRGGGAISAEERASP